MVETILKYMGESLKESITFLDVVHAPVRRLITGVICKADSAEKKDVSINDQEGKVLYLRQVNPEQVTETAPKTSCSKNYEIKTKCRAVFFSFSNHELSADKIKSVLASEIGRVNFRKYKGSSYNINVTNTAYSDDFEKIFLEETGKPYEGDQWPIIIAIDFTLSYEDVNCNLCDINSYICL